MPQLWVVCNLRLYGRLRGGPPSFFVQFGTLSLRHLFISVYLRDTPVHVVTSINRFSRYELERQFFGGLRTHEKEAPFHGTRATSI